MCAMPEHKVVMVQIPTRCFAAKATEVWTPSLVMPLACCLNAQVRHPARVRDSFEVVVLVLVQKVDDVSDHLLGVVVLNLTDLPLKQLRGIVQTIEAPHVDLFDKITDPLPHDVLIILI